jgi:hypothetical protein
MKNSILNIGNALNKTEQKAVFGGGEGCLPGLPWPCHYYDTCSSDGDCAQTGREVVYCIGGRCLPI